jgi:hypothetical protein
MDEHIGWLQGVVRVAEEIHPACLSIPSTFIKRPWVNKREIVRFILWSELSNGRLYAINLICSPKSGSFYNHVPQSKQNNQMSRSV